MGEKRYELRLARRDGKRLHHGPRPVIEQFDIDRQRELEEVVGKHFIPMAAAAEGKTDWLTPWRKVWECQSWLPKYQIEIWRADGYWNEPERVSTSTRGWEN